MRKFTCVMKFLCDTREKEEYVFKQVELPRYLQEIIDALKKEPRAKIFLHKVNKKDAPNYYDIIKNPMDLGTVERKIMIYNDLSEFKADLDLIWDNCLKYNTAEYFLECANEMRAIADNLINVRRHVYPKCPETVLYRAPDIIQAKDLLRESVARYFYEIGIRKLDKKIIQILSDVLEYKICKEIMKLKDKII